MGNQPQIYQLLLGHNTRDEYYSRVRAFGLKPSNVRTVYPDNDGMTYSVPDPDEYTAEQRLEILQQIKRRLSID